MSSTDTITLQRASLYRYVYIAGLSSFFLFFTKTMLLAPSSISLPGVTVTEDLQIQFLDEHKKPYLIGFSDFNQQEGEATNLDFCGSQQNTETCGCLEEDNNQQIKITQIDSGEAGVSCHLVRREGLRCVNQMVKDCYSLGQQHWYGGFEAFTQYWPMKKSVPVVLTEEGKPERTGVELQMGPYISGDFGVHKVELLGILDRFVVSSQGVGISVNGDSPLYMSFNQHGDGKICLAGMFDGIHYTSPLGRPPVLEYKVCRANDVKTIHGYMKRQNVKKADGTPSLSIIEKPIWSTWANFNKAINQTLVMQFADNILSNNFPCSQLEIDDDWTPAYGDLEFDPVKFPNPKAMIESLNEKGLPVTVWVHPFISLKSKAFKVATRNRFTVMAKGADIPALVRWWNEDMAALLDVSNPAAVLWFQKQLLGLKERYSIVSFKFDAGEGLYIPSSHNSFRHLSSSNEYATLWAELAHGADTESRRQEVRVGWKSQHIPVWVRMMDKLSTWGKDSGLQSMIPTALTMGIMGYPFILPDMIGGNAYADIETFKGGAYPDKELYIRWLQLCVFMPSLQFSVAPWVYGEDMVKITQLYMQIREKYVPLLKELAKESGENSDPIVRPLWWVSPQDEQALLVEDEFLVGNDLLVAPVVVEGARKRDIYVPEGVWVDQLRGGSIQGPTFLNDYLVALEELAFFEREKPEE